MEWWQRAKWRNVQRCNLYDSSSQIQLIAIFWVFFTASAYQFSFYPVLAEHTTAARTHTTTMFVVKFNRQTCQMNMETRRYVYTYFILGQRIHCDTHRAVRACVAFASFSLCPNTHGEWSSNMLKMAFMDFIVHFLINILRK